MHKDQFFAIADGEALHFKEPTSIPWDKPCQAASFNELAHILQYRWFKEVIKTRPPRGGGEAFRYRLWLRIRYSIFGKYA
jgi:hypothetical protein